MMVIESKYEIGDMVYLITDPDGYPRMVTSIIVNKYDILYRLNLGTSSSEHYDYEISTEKTLHLT